MQHRLIATSIPYMNAGPHMGHAMEFIIADIIARYNRASGNDVFFLTGADEHGSKIYNKAKELEKGTLQMLDEHVTLFKELEASLSIIPDDFIRTTDQVRHWPTAQAIWQKLAAKGDIYKKKYSGFYCEGCEVFMPEKDLDAEGNCPIHHKKPTLLEEENHFFQLSKYEYQLKKIISDDTVKIVPEFRKNEILSFLNEGLNDVSFSRSADKMPWGIPVPGDETQVMYVWCDALTNYLSGIGYSFDQEKFNTYYPTYLHVIGKDISRFHAIIYMAMLLSVDMETSKNILVHGFVTSEGEKMSKSLGNVVVPEDVINIYGADALRYFITVGGGGVGEDIDYTQTGFHNLYNSGLVNGLGNIANRTSTLFCKYYPEGTDTNSFVLDSEIEGVISGAYKTYTTSLEVFDLRTGYTAISTLIDLANKYFDEEKPWTIKDDPEKLRNVLLNLVEILYHINILVAPFLPQTAEKMREIFSLTDSKLASFFIDPSFGLTQANTTIKLVTVPLLFEKK
ncbi:MAG: methionine--tRNA ligase [Candidatus Gracilibacteria bacterium]|nr:methionine--tRNA ligase [Candidatus Gracilibacteria bacterium]